MKPLFTLEELKNAFVAGELFEKNKREFECFEVEKITEPDFDNYISVIYDIDIAENN